MKKSTIVKIVADMLDALSDNADYSSVDIRFNNSGADISTMIVYDEEIEEEK